VKSEAGNGLLGSKYIDFMYLSREIPPVSEIFALFHPNMVLQISV
jgi:hypothetical protein